MSGGYTALGAALLSAAGEATNSYAQNQNLKQQQNQTIAQINEQKDLQQQAEARVKNTVQTVKQANPNAAQDQQLEAYKKALTQQAQNVTSPTGMGASVPGGSKRYAQAEQAAQSNVNNYANTQATNAAATAGAQLQRLGEGQSIASTASDLGMLQDTSQNQQGILKTQLAGDQADPWLTALSGALQGAGNGLGTYAGTQYGKKKSSSGSGVGVFGDSGLADTGAVNA